MDLGIEVILELFSREGLEKAFDFAIIKKQVKGEAARRMVALKKEYLTTIDAVISFLQGKNQTLARQIASEKLLPEGKRFNQIVALDLAILP